MDINVKFMSTIRNFELNEINKQLVYSFLIYADIKENYDIGKCHDYEWFSLKEFYLIFYLVNKF